VSFHPRTCIDTVERLLELYAAGRRDFPGLIFNDVRGNTTLWDRANLSGINLDGSDFADGNYIEGTDFSNASLVGISAYNVTFDRCNFRNADLRGANLIKTRWNGSDLSGVDFSYANLTRANFSEALCKGGHISLDFTNLTEANFQGSFLSLPSMGSKDYKRLGDRGYGPNATLFWNTILKDGTVEIGPILLADCE
jgi:uncharacterized protein YjbI with pentapeptide repeats